MFWEVVLVLMAVAMLAMPVYMNRRVDKTANGSQKGILRPSRALRFVLVWIIQIAISLATTVIVYQFFGESVGLAYAVAGIFIYGITIIKLVIASEDPLEHP